MSNMMLDLFGEDLPQEENVAEFHYELFDIEDRTFIQEQEYEIRVHWKRAAGEIIDAGEKLLLVQQRLMDANKGKHGSFEGWLKRADFSRGNAFFAMKAFRRFGKREKKSLVETFSPSELKELTYAPDEIVEQVISGSILPTKDAIREAKKAKREAEEKEKQARIAESKARADAKAAQLQLLLVKEASGEEITALTKQNAALQKQVEDLSTPQIEIRTVEKEVVPQSVINEIEDLRRQLIEAGANKAKEIQSLENKLQAEITKLNTNLETQKKSLSPETKKKLDEMQKQVEKLTKERDLQEERIKKLNADIDMAIRKREFADNADRIRQKWRAMNSEVHACLMRLLGQWPTPVDVQTFDADDWAYADHLKQTLRRVLEECNHLRLNGDEMIVDLPRWQGDSHLMIVNAEAERAI